jgi:hypothetical protein
MIQSLPSGSRQYVSNHLTTDTLETEICGQRLSTARAANGARRRPKRLSRPTDAAASRGNVVLFCGVGNHARTCGLPGGAEGIRTDCHRGRRDPTKSGISCACRLPFTLAKIRHGAAAARLLRPRKPSRPGPCTAGRRDLVHEIRREASSARQGAPARFHSLARQGRGSIRIFPIRTAEFRPGERLRPGVDLLVVAGRRGIK